MGCAILRFMTKQEALAFYEGNQSALARALGIDQSTVNQWKRVPLHRQLQLEALTGGKLKAGPECDPFRLPKAREAA